MRKEYNFKDTVCIRGRGDCAIASKRYIRRGRYAGKAEYKLASLREQGFAGKTYCVIARGEGLFREAKGTYTEDQINAAIAKVHDTRREIDVSKAARADENREKLGEQEWVRGKGIVGTKIAPGDSVVVRYRGGIRRTEMVVKVNFSNGKVAIKAPSYSKGYRWIQASSVVDTVSRHRKLPCSISDATFDALHGNGWAQIKVGIKFIERSYVVAFTREGARGNGTDWDGSSTVVFLDPDLKLFWRDTGSWD